MFTRAKRLHEGPARGCPGVIISFVYFEMSALSNLARYDTIRPSNGTEGGTNTCKFHPVSSSSFLTEMIGSGLLKSIDTMKDHPWSDPEVLEGKILQNRSFRGFLNALSQISRFSVIP